MGTLKHNTPTHHHYHLCLSLTDSTAVKQTHHSCQRAPRRCIWESHHVANSGWHRSNESRLEWHYDNDWERQMWTSPTTSLALSLSLFFFHLSCRLAGVDWVTPGHRLDVFKGILKPPGKLLVHHTSPMLQNSIERAQSAAVMSSITFNNTCSAVVSCCDFTMQLITGLMESLELFFPQLLCSVTYF